MPAQATILEVTTFHNIQLCMHIPWPTFPNGLYFPFSSGIWQLMDTSEKVDIFKDCTGKSELLASC